MYSKRGGRVQVNMMQYYELVERVENLEKLHNKEEVKHEAIEPAEENEVIEADEVEKIVLTKNKAMALLDEKGIKYNPRDKKDVLVELLNNEVETCQEDQTESD
jgi:ATP-dependent protease HslVU (ClpYQ) ATPase subunit